MARGPGFYAGLLIGAAIGAGAALLLAPKPGEQMRQELIEGLEGGGEWRERVEEASSLARAAADTVIEVSKDLIDQQRLRFEEAVRESREAAEETTAEMLAEFKKAQRGQDGSAS